MVWFRRIKDPCLSILQVLLKNHFKSFLPEHGASRSCEKGSGHDRMFILVKAQGKNHIISGERKPGFGRMCLPVPDTGDS